MPRFLRVGKPDASPCVFYLKDVVSEVFMNVAIALLRTWCPLILHKQVDEVSAQVLANEAYAADMSPPLACQLAY